MCGIFAVLNGANNDAVLNGANNDAVLNGANNDAVLNGANNDANIEINESINDSFQLGRGRGPEFSTLNHIKENLLFGFHRLAINGLNPESNQPIVINGVYLICNGEIYNYKILFDMINIIYTLPQTDLLQQYILPQTNSDCEIIIHLYIKYGFDHMLKMLDGVFAIILYDSNINKLFVARDYYGVRPLYFVENYNYINNGKILQISAFASEIKMLNIFSDENSIIRHFPPSGYCEIDTSKPKHPIFIIKYYNRPNSTFIYQTSSSVISASINSILEAITPTLQGIRYYLTQAVYKRCEATERPIACLLSGGLDSSLIAALVVEYYKINRPLNAPPIETYSIGLAESEDLKYARIVANYLGTNHTEIILTEEDFINAIPQVIYAVESYDTTTIRASIGNYKLGEYISQHSEAKVIFNGDGSDELCGGYLYMENCPDCIEFDKETNRLLDEIYMFDVLRSDKCISSHGLEPRTPFLDKSWTQFYLSIPANLRRPNSDECTKYLLRQAFSKNNQMVIEDLYENYHFIENRQILPDEILWRRKEAFSDGVSKQSKSLYQIIQESDPVLNIVYENTSAHELTPLEKEKKYYKTIFDYYYLYSNIIPHFWMPKYINAIDASARLLPNYNK